MNELLKYNKIFCEIFGAEDSVLNENFTSDRVDAWDSIGHMNLISTIEEEFNILMDGDDIMNFRSYETGKAILEKYNISFS